MTPPATRSGMRMSADERRSAVLVAAMAEFAKGGYSGTSTEDIAARAGISQPYLFRLFNTKRELFIAAVTAGFDRVESTFEAASAGLEGEEALMAMGASYRELLADSELLRLQLNGYAACGDPVIQAAVGARFEALSAYIATRTGVAPVTLRDFFATGMLLNVVAALGIEAEDGSWASVICVADLASCAAEAAR